MLTRLLATLPTADPPVYSRDYLDVASDYPTTELTYWREHSEINAAILHREGIPLAAIGKTGPIVQDLARVLDAARRD